MTKLKDAQAKATLQSQIICEVEFADRYEAKKHLANSDEAAFRAIEYLAKEPEEEEVEFFMELYHQFTYWFPRMDIVNALQYIGTPEAIEHLRFIARTSHQPTIRGFALRSLIEHESPHWAESRPSNWKRSPLWQAMTCYHQFVAGEIDLVTLRAIADREHKAHKDHWMRFSSKYVFYQGHDWLAEEPEEG